MEELSPFTGFTRDTMQFFSQLKRNNKREWFERHKDEYLAHVLRPARAFVAEMGPALGRVYPAIVADPGANGSIFRIYRDTRFSGDKQPYKTHLGIFFWLSGGKKMDRPGFYFELDDTGIRLYFGWYMFPPQVLKRYRDAVADEDSGVKLVEVVKKVRRAGIEVGGEHYKRVPKGYEVDGSREEFIRYNTIYTQEDLGKPKEMFRAKLVGLCVRRWKMCAGIYEWVQQIL